MSYLDIIRQDAEGKLRTRRKPQVEDFLKDILRRMISDEGWSIVQLTRDLDLSYYCSRQLMIVVLEFIDDILQTLRDVLPYAYYVGIDYHLTSRRRGPNIYLMVEMTRGLSAKAESQIHLR